MKNDIHDRLFDELQSRIATLQSGALATGAGGARTQDEIDAEVSRLVSDQRLLLDHWKTENGVVQADEPVRAQACGNPQPCPHILELAQRYGFI